MRPRQHRQQAGLYSAKLFVRIAQKLGELCQHVARRRSVITAPNPAGPGLPRAPRHRSARESTPGRPPPASARLLLQQKETFHPSLADHEIQ